MRRLYLDHRRRNDVGPAVHALIVGVGHYHYLTGKHLRYDGYTDLRSAPVSAMRFLTCLLATGPAQWSLPVATVDVLLSPERVLTNLDREAVEIADPTIDNIHTAFEEWLERCGTHPDNIAVLYFCGHGAQAEQHVLLASDFAKHDRSPFRGAFDFDTTRDGLLTEPPATQCLFIDACRVPLTEEVRRKRHDGVGALMTAEEFAERTCRFDLTLRAPFLDEFGAPPDETGEPTVSFFTAALVKALDGQAAVEDSNTGDWVMSNESVSRVMTDLLQRELGGVTGRAVEGAAIFERTVLRRLDAAPPTEISVHWDPAIRTGMLSCTPSPSLRPPYTSAASGNQPWRFTAEAGHYLATAICDHRSYVAHEHPLFALPPTASVTVRRMA